ncbi:hypothetical protein Pcinc_020114 [Petrolisthes cinctipes]|uniref:Adenosine deaminase domain-containing protein n=1 Tax=Petrolisthes cinctipes TaxID=88211 RepID=A0AAE1KKJ2_PETCI|nr:hypothetical protein Pcinc_020114 [Petrolisthes cinctipes]
MCTWHRLIPKEQMDLLTYCRNLPKVELHAHLTGSLSDDTVLQLLEAKEKELGSKNSLCSAKITISKGHQRSLDECFRVFELLHSLTDSLEAIRKITQNVIQEFAEDGVRYLELRTTPKNILGKMTKKEYVDTVLEAMINEMKTCRIMVRLLVSVDRGRGVEDAWSTLSLAKQYLDHDVFKGLLVGIDVSGNPNKGNLADYIPILKEAKKCGFKLAVHLAEVKSCVEETDAVLQNGLVDRIGHGTYLLDNNGYGINNQDMILKHHIPIEICLSSNVKTESVSSFEDHHFPVWHALKHPLAVSTDDKGVFSTTLSNEYYICAKTFNLSEKDIHELCLHAVEATFLPSSDKDILRQMVKDDLSKLMGKLFLGRMTTNTLKPSTVLEICTPKELS